MTDSRPRKYLLKLRTNQVIQVIEYQDGTIEVPCTSCDEPMLLGANDLFDVVEDDEGEPVAFLCTACAKRARKALGT